MSQPLSTVAQYAMDEYYQNFRADLDFFDLPDFVFHCGNTVTDYYKQEYDKMRAENRQDKQDEILSFSSDVLSQQEVELKWVDNVLTAVLEYPFMSFPYDVWNTGLQTIIPASGKDLGIFKRSALAEIWKFTHLPEDNKIYWYPAGGLNINFYKNCNCNVKTAIVFYVPSVNDNMSVPDGIIAHVVNNTVAMMKQIKEGTVVKKELDRNQNQTLQTEANPMALK